MTAAQQPERLDEHDQLREDLIGLVGAGDVERLAFAERLKGRLDRDRSAAGESLRLWAMWWRDVMLVQSGLAERVANDDRLSTLDELARTRSAREVVDYLAQIREIAAQLGQGVNPQLALDVLFLQTPSAVVVSR